MFSLRLCGEYLVAVLPRCEGVNELETVELSVVPSSYGADGVVAHTPCFRMRC
jgi:hypothetical protein